MTLTGIDVLTDQEIDLDIDSGIDPGIEHRFLSRRPDSPGSAGEFLPDSETLYVSPGWLDLQVNGWKGIDYNGDSLDSESLKTICMSLAACGTTRHLPTVITASQQDITRRLQSLRRLRSESLWLASRIPGFHVEGPYISKLDGPRGAHDARYVRNPSVEEFEEWQEAAGGLIRIVTLAPETAGALEFIETVASRRVVVSLGHTAADPGLIREAAAAGARMSTHLGNGLAGTIKRYENPLWEQLASDRLTASLIADGHHLPEAFIRTAFRAKGPERTVLVSDAAPPGGMEPGSRVWAGMKVDVNDEGRISLAGTPYLAGAGHLQDRGIGFFMYSTGCSLKEAVTACTLTPAALIGLEPEVEPASGYRDMVVFRLIPDAGRSGRRVVVEQIRMDGSDYTDSQP